MLHTSANESSLHHRLLQVVQFESLCFPENSIETAAWYVMPVLKLLDIICVRAVDPDRPVFFESHVGLVYSALGRTMCYVNFISPPSACLHLEPVSN